MMMSSAAAGRLSMEKPRCILSQKHNVDHNNRRWESRLSLGSRVSSWLLVRVCSRIALSAAASGLRDPRAFAGVPLHTQQRRDDPCRGCLGLPIGCGRQTEALSAIVMHEPEPLLTFLQGTETVEATWKHWKRAVLGVRFEASRGLCVATCPTAEADVEQFLFHSRTTGICSLACQEGNSSSTHVLNI